MPHATRHMPRTNCLTSRVASHYASLHIVPAIRWTNKSTHSQRVRLPTSIIETGTTFVHHETIVVDQHPHAQDVIIVAAQHLRSQTNVLDRIFEAAQMDVPYPLAPCAWEDTRTESSNAKRPKHGTTLQTLFAPESAEYSPCEMAVQSAATGNELRDAATPHTTVVTFVLDAPHPLTEHKSVLERRKLKALTPYDPDAWEACLTKAGLIDRYSHIPEGLRQGFLLNLPVITKTQIPPNKNSILIYTNEFQSIIKSEIQKERYIGPCTAAEIESFIGPFQSSPLSIIPKPGRPG